jgi:NADH-quinone oxidoreductase subunit L
MATENLLLLVLLLPFVGSILSFCPMPRPVKGFLAVTVILIGLLGAVGLTQSFATPTFYWAWEWFQIGNNPYFISFYLDNYALGMLILVYSIALPVFIYSTAYMKSDPSWTRYWIYLQLFVFGMLLLIAAGNLLLLYIGWELVGVSSYLLIGFWHQKTAAIQANKKAFLINRIGDIGMLSAIGMIFAHTHTLELTSLWDAQQAALNLMPEWALWIAGLGFLIAAMAKSAQFPFQSWLPDAMEGPTSVSSLLHAATMVAAGVYVLIRVEAIFLPSLLTIMAYVGAITALLGAYFALYSIELKRILAFSTISQLGYMVAGIGILSSDAAFFHLLTHAFFKCALFLIAGIFLHISHQQASNHSNASSFYAMKGFARKYPLMGILFVFAWMGLNGLPLSAGFISKELILSQSLSWASLSQGSWGIPIILIGTAFLTAIYSSKILWQLWKQPGLNMVATFPKLPIAYPIALLLLTPGILWIGFSLHPLNPQYSWVYQFFANISSPTPVHWALPLSLLALTVLGLYLAYKHVNKSQQIPNGVFARMAQQQGYVDLFIQQVLVKIGMSIAKGSAWIDRNILDGLLHGLSALGKKLADWSAWIDRQVFDGTVNGAGRGTWQLSQWGKWAQNGQIQGYLRWMLIFFIIGIILIIRY